VYIIEAGNGHKKIGVAKDVVKRLAALKTGISTGVKSIHATELMPDAHKVENSLHSINNKIRLSGEWFDGDIDLGGYDFNEFDEKMTQIEPRYLSINPKYITLIFNIQQSTQKILGYILDSMNDENEITIASGGKTKMLEKLEMKPQTLNNGLAQLTKAMILANPYRGVYIANPNIFTLKKKWGDTLNQQKKFSAQIKYTGRNDQFTINAAWDD
jgi:hypothetical protein